MNSTMLLAKIGQLNEKIENVNGASAYEIAQENGYEGTEEEWLESLKVEGHAPGSMPTEELDDCNNAKEGVNVTTKGPKNGPKYQLYGYTGVLEHYSSGDAKVQRFTIVGSEKYKYDVGKEWQREFRNGTWHNWKEKVLYKDELNYDDRYCLYETTTKSEEVDFDSFYRIGVYGIGGVLLTNAPVQEKGVLFVGGCFFNDSKVIQIYMPNELSKGKVYYRFMRYKQTFDDWKLLGEKGSDGERGPKGEKGEKGEKGNGLKFKSFKQSQAFSSFEKWANGTEVVFSSQFFDQDELTKGDNLAITGEVSDKSNLKVLLVGVIREISDGTVKFIGKSLTSLSDGVSSNVYTKAEADKNFISKRTYASLSDLDNQEDTGFAKISSLSAGHLPPGVKWGISQFVHENPGVTDSHGRKAGVQIYYPIDGENKDYLFYRSVLGSWSDWKQIATTKYVDQKMAASDLGIEERDGWIIERNGNFVTLSISKSYGGAGYGAFTVPLPITLDGDTYTVSMTPEYKVGYTEPPSIKEKGISSFTVISGHNEKEAKFSFIVKGKVSDKTVLEET